MRLKCTKPSCRSWIGWPQLLEQDARPRKARRRFTPNDWQLCERIPYWIWLRQRAHKHFRKKGLTRSLPAVLCAFVWNGAANYRVQQTQGVWGKVTGPTDDTKVVAGGTKQPTECRMNKGRAVFHLCGSWVYDLDANIICSNDASQKIRQKHLWREHDPKEFWCAGT